MAIITGIAEFRRKIGIGTISGAVHGSLPFAQLCAVFALIVVPFSVLFWASPGVVVDGYLHDFFIPLSGAWQILAGHVPHVDFSTPLGPLYYGLHAVAMKLGSASAHAAIDAKLIALPFIAAAALWVAYRRLPAVPALVFSLLVSFISLSPRGFGLRFTVLTHQATYNRWAWALTCILFLLLFLPVNRTRTTHAERRRYLSDAESVLAGFLLVALLYLKLPNFVVGVAALGLFAALVERSWRPIVAAGAVLLAAVALIEALLGFHRAYINDILMAASASDVTMVGPFVKHALASAFDLALIGVIVALGLSDETSRRAIAETPPRTILVLVVIAGFIVAAGLQLRAQDTSGNASFGANHASEIPVLAVLALIAFETIRRVHQAAGGGRATPPALVGGFLIAMLCSATILVPDMLAVSYHAALAYKLDRDGEAPLAGTQAGDVLVRTDRSNTASPHYNRLVPIEAADDAKRGLSNRLTAFFHSQVEFRVTELAHVYADGARLVSRHATHDEATLSLYYNNPFPFALGMRPAIGDVITWHTMRTFSERRSVPAPRLFGDARFVAVPKLANNYEDVELLWSIYGDYVRSHYRLVGESRYWKLWRRN